MILRSQLYATHSEWDWLTKPLKRRLRGHRKPFGVAIVVFCEMLENLKIIFLRTTNKRRVSYILTSSQYSTHSDTNELWLPLRQLLESIKVVWSEYLYGFVTLQKNAKFFATRLQSQFRQREPRGWIIINPHLVHDDKRNVHVFGWLLCLRILCSASSQTQTCAGGPFQKGRFPFRIYHRLTNSWLDSDGAHFDVFIQSLCGETSIWSLCSSSIESHCRSFLVWTEHSKMNDFLQNLWQIYPFVARSRFCSFWVCPLKVHVESSPWEFSVAFPLKAIVEAPPLGDGGRGSPAQVRLGDLRWPYRPETVGWT